MPSPFSDLRYITRDLEFNWCAITETGVYNLCVKEDLPSTPTGMYDGSSPSAAMPGPVPTANSMTRPNSNVRPSPATMPQPAMSPIYIANLSKVNDSSDSGFPGWAIFLITLFCASILGFVAITKINKKRSSSDLYYDDNSQYTNNNNNSQLMDDDTIVEHESWVKSSQSIRSIGTASYGSRTTRDVLRQLSRANQTSEYDFNHSNYDLSSLKPKRDPPVCSGAGSVVFCSTVAQERKSDSRHDAEEPLQAKHNIYSINY